MPTRPGKKPERQERLAEGIRAVVHPARPGKQSQPRPRLAAVTGGQFDFGVIARAKSNDAGAQKQKQQQSSLMASMSAPLAGAGGGSGGGSGADGAQKKW